MAAPITPGKSKDHRSRRNPQSAEAFAERRQAANATPERKIVQARYLLKSIQEALRAGRKRFEDAETDSNRLIKRLEALEA
jgi:hypothetical protein